MGSLANQPNPAIINFIIQEVDNHPHDIATLTAKHFNVTRVTACRYLQRLVAEQRLVAKGTTKAREYKLRDLVDETFMFRVTPQTQDDELWHLKLAAIFAGASKNIIDICQYGVTELINNVIEHSGSEACSVHVKRDAKRISITVKDYGVGILNKIATQFHLENPKHALLELIKGKLTTSPHKHTGEGIFFVSRLFTSFTIVSGKLMLHCEKSASDWLVESKELVQLNQGTAITMVLNVGATHTVQNVLEQYIDEDGKLMRTEIPVLLSQDGDELVSRSQAKRLLARCEHFSEVVLDFKGVHQAGQAFLDEVFRVYKGTHAKTKITAIHVSEPIQKMISHVG